MQTKIKQLKLLIHLEENKKTKALADYTKANNSYKNFVIQHKQLIEYRGEYYQRLYGKDETMQATSLILYHQFIEKLNAVIKEQDKKVKSSKQQSDLLFKKFITIRQKMEGLDKLLTVELENEINSERKKEQKQYDESASNQWYINRKD